MELNNPFRVTGPTCISFSFGRSSAYMLRQILDAHEGRLPDDAVVLSCNTGKEHPASLEFGAAIAREWGIPITLLEYRPGRNFEVVSFENASRDGQPFEAIIADRGGLLPNRVARYCSSEMKTRTMHRYIRQRLGWTEWDSMIGIRSDEPRRVASFRARPHPETKAETVRIPLADAGVSADDVGRFWDSNSFDLELPNIGGKTMHGNCTRCFLKAYGTIVSLELEQHDPWWAERERLAESITKGPGCRFRNDRPSYAEITQFNERQTQLFASDSGEAIGCICTD